MRLLSTFAAIACPAIMLALGAHAAAQATPPSPPCAAAEFRQMDFWLGTWDVRWEAAAGTPAGKGTNTITKAFSDCVVQEDFDGGPATGNLVGRSVSVYHAPIKRWRQTWVDNQGGYFALVGGKEGDTFVLVSARLQDNAPVQRMVFESIKANSLTWRWQKTPDGGKTWQDQWVIFYTRRG